MLGRSILVAPLVLAVACGTAEKPPAAATAVDPACFGSRVLSFQDLVAEVVIPPGQSCDSGSFMVVFTRGTDTVATPQDPRMGVVGFIGTSDINGDGRGEFFIATTAVSPDRHGMLHAYADSPEGVGRLPIAPLDSAQTAGYAGGDRFGLGGGDQLVRSFVRTQGDTVWFAYSFPNGKWSSITRPEWLR